MEKEPSIAARAESGSHKSISVGLAGDAVASPSLLTLSEMYWPSVTRFVGSFRRALTSPVRQRQLRSG